MPVPLTRLATAVLCGLGVATGGCVLGAEQRPPRDAVKRGPIVVDRRTAATYVLERRHARVAELAPASAGNDRDAAWLAGHVHWSGVEYVVIEGQWEPEFPAYTWAPRAGMPARR